MTAFKRAAAAVTEATSPGVTRERSLKALGSFSFTGEPFTLWLTGLTKKQKELVLRTLKKAEVIELAAQARKGAKAQYRATLAYRDPAPSNGAASAEVLRDTTTDDDEDGVIWARFDSFDGPDWRTLLRNLPKPERTLAGGLFEEIWPKAVSAGLDKIGGKLGAAIEAVCWTLAAYPEGVTFEELPTETEEELFSKRTMENALRKLREAGIVTVRGSGTQRRSYTYENQATTTTEEQ